MHGLSGIGATRHLRWLDALARGRASSRDEGRSVARATILLWALDKLAHSAVGVGKLPTSSRCSPCPKPRCARHSNVPSRTSGKRPENACPRCRRTSAPAISRTPDMLQCKVMTLQKSRCGWWRRSQRPSFRKADFGEHESCGTLTSDWLPALIRIAPQTPAIVDAWCCRRGSLCRAIQSSCRWG